jgi:hypothetical protein
MNDNKSGDSFMKNLLIFAFVCLLVISGSAQYGQISNFESRSSDKKAYNRQAVLVELFTSQSCASCPPAEKMLTTLQTEQPFEQAELITLAFHVDYRDGFGWTDKYASSLFTQRQKVYDRKFRTGKLYTPQMVVDGDIEFIGSKMDKAEKAVEKSLKNKKASVDLTIENERLKVKISAMPEHEDATVYLAIAEDGINTRVSNGENAGKDLGHVSLVRVLKGLGRIAPNKNSFELDTNFQIQTDWKKENIKLIVFIQENSSRIIRGSNVISLKPTNADRKL